MKKKKLRISYTLLDLWSKGKTDQAIATYFHLPTPTNEAMRYGRAKHEEVAEVIEKTGQLPGWLSHIKLNAPQPEKKYIVEYNEHFDVSAILDCLDVPRLYEFKFSTSDSLEWAGKGQIPFYFLVAELAGLKIDKAFLIRYDKSTKKSDFTIVWNSPDKVERAKNMIDSLAPEILDHFIAQGLL